MPSTEGGAIELFAKKSSDPGGRLPADRIHQDDARPIYKDHPDARNHQAGAISALGYRAGDEDC